MVTGNAFQILIDLKKKFLAILFVRQKGFNREGPLERVEIEEDFRIVKWSSKFIEINYLEFYSTLQDQLFIF